MPHLATGDADDLRAGVGKLCLDQLDMAQQRSTGLGQLDAAAAVMVEPGSELALQAMHALGETWLRHVQGFGRMAQIEPLGRRQKELQLTIVHNYVPSVMLSRTL